MYYVFLKVLLIFLEKSHQITKIVNKYFHDCQFEKVTITSVVIDDSIWDNITDLVVNTLLLRHGSTRETSRSVLSWNKVGV